MAKSVEVKTRKYLSRPTEITDWPVDMKAKGDAGFFIFIELDLRSMSPTCYMLTNMQARESHKEYKGGGNLHIKTSHHNWPAFTPPQWPGIQPALTHVRRQISVLATG